MKEIGKIRRSQVISTYGPGAIIDFRSSAGAPISSVSTGLDDWDYTAIRKGLLNEQVINELRLEKKLGVGGFRLPPVGDELTGKRDAKGRPLKKPRQLPATRFPNWHFCPSCDLLRHTRYWNQEPGKYELSCSDCSGKPGKPKNVFVIPVRFIVTCENGHLSDFPWASWCDHDEGCAHKKPLKLVTIGAGLSGLFVVCSDCGGKKSLGTAFSHNSLVQIGHSCSGKSPWLPKAAEICAKPPAVIQRGASNAYFPIMESAISIPPWGDTFEESLGEHWRRLTKIDDRTQVRNYVEQWILDDWSGPSISLDELVAKIDLRLRLLDSVDTENLRVEEYAHLSSGEATDEGEEVPSFQICPEQIPVRWNQHIQHLVRVERLREIRVLKGFTRLTPMDIESAERPMAPLSVDKKNWLPAIEVFGEGIFVGLDEVRLTKWEERDDVQERICKLVEQVERDWKERYGKANPMQLDLSARFLMIHTLAHSFITRLSLDCGYSSSSIRERLYVGRGKEPMCGFLIYTSAPDSDGTLGGLSREGRADSIDSTLLHAIQDLEWCSSDPLCSDGFSSYSDSSNLAACHSCCFLPETACEHFNRYLDRALVTGIPGNPSLGYFNEIEN